jgi:GNAT superfamily N-acetyltransferase
MQVDEASRLAIRRATRADLPAIIALLADDILGAQRESVSDPPAPVYLAAFERIESDPLTLLLVAELDGAVVGTAQVHILHNLGRQGSTRAQVEAVRIGAAWRSRGLGRQLMEWIAEYARAHGARLIQLTTDKSRPDAHRFYRALGYEATHEGMKLPLA